MDAYQKTALMVVKNSKKCRLRKKTILAGVFLGSISFTVVAAMTSPIYGGGGGVGFTDSVASTQTLTGINVKGGWWLDSIQGVTNTGNLPFHGGTGGNAYTVTWPSNEYLVRTYGTYGSYDGSWTPLVGKISFVTNTGRVLGPYGAGMGGTSTYAFNYTVPTGNKIVGFTGRAGIYMDALGVVYDVLSTTTPTTPGNLIVNGSFEANVVAANSAQFFASVSGWTGSGDNIEIGTANVYGVSGATGIQVAELDAAVKGANTGFFQMVTTQANATYTLSVDIAARAGYALATNSVEVWWRNQYVTTIDPASTAFKTYTLNLQGSGGSDRLEFREQAGDDNGVGGIIDNVKLVLNTVAVNAPDLAVVAAQPSPALVANALSEIPVTVTNQGTLVANAPITLTLPLPTGVIAPLKFTRNADAWTCLNQSTTLSCTSNKPLAVGASTTIRLPIRPAANTVGSIPGPFVAKVAAVAGETNTANNSSPAMTPTTAVQALNLGSIPDPNYSTPLLDPTIIPKYALPLPNLASSFFAHTPNTTTVPGTDLYNLTIKQVNTQILPPGFPATPIYAYGDPAKPETFSYPSHTIVANSVATGLNASGLGKPVKIQFTDTRDPLLAHLLPVDHSIHGAMAGEPDIRSVAHMHGMRNIDQKSDGYPEGWSSPTGQIGNQFTVTSPTQGFNPNPFDYPNNQEATMMWFHDHSLGMTRLNVYAGMAGAYVLRDSNELAMINNKSLPSGAYEVPLVLQDKAFKADGSLAYPDLNPDVATAPAVSMVPEFYGNVMLVNGVAWPFLEVEPRKYRFRMLNGSSSRFYNLKLSNNASFQVIGTEGGFLAAPTTVTSLTVAPAERYDVIIDFSTMNGQTITVTNSANSPFPGGTPVVAGIDDQIMQFRINQPLSAVPNNPLPTSLRPGGVPALTPTVATPRQVLLAESTDNNGRILPILGTVANGLLGWMDTVTETPKAGSIERWEIFNDTVDAHPIHLHGGHFQVVDRYDFTATAGVNHALTNIAYPTVPVVAAPQERTWKDTVISYPGQVTRINVKFDNPGLFVWHCHILEHEDHDMMRPMLVQ